MILSRLCCILAALVLLTSAGTALQLDIAGEKEWLVAGGDTAGLSLVISGGSSPFTITATVPPDGLCTVTPASFTTSSIRPDPMQVKSKEKSGVCLIDIKVTDAGGNSVTQQFSQKIDHTTPGYAGGIAPQGATVGTVVPVKVWLQDRYHNIVDNRNIVETVGFTTYGSSGFVDGPSTNPDLMVQTTTAPVNKDGVAEIQYYVGEYVSKNYITFTPPAPLVPGILILDGIPNGVPASIVTYIVPDAATPPWVYADGSSKFTITYSVSDTNGFPVQAAGITGFTSEGKSFSLVTNENGQASYYYGPFSMAGQHTITASLDANSAVRVVDRVEIISMAPEHLLATGNPISMPSLDVSPGSTSTITGRVSDPKGNPVSGQTVTFEITSVTASTKMKKDPYLTSQGKIYAEKKSVTLVTNNDGIATLQFIPGEFAKSRTDPDFDPSAEGTATITATWGSKTEPITLTFKRTAYLSLETKVEPLQVPVGGTFDVTVNVTGDGSMMTSYPIEVMLVTDRSGSMEMSMGGQTRFYWVKQASHAFLDALNPGKDRVGLVSYHTWATKDHDLTSDFTSLGTTIDTLTIPRANDWIPNKGPVRLTNMRDGIFNATTYLKIYGSKSDKVNKAIVVLTDGVWNWGGTPLAKGRGYAEKTRTVVWEDTYFGANCASGSACLQKYRTDSFYWPGAVSFSMYTYYNQELYKDPQGNPVMTDPGPLAYSGAGLGPAHRFDGRDGSNGYLCHPIVPLNKDPGGPAWDPNMCVKNTGMCNSDIGCYSNDKYRVDVCDKTYTGTDCSSSEQNMAVFAKNNHIRIYTITYAENYDQNTFDAPYKDVAAALTELSESTGGKYYHAATGADLEKVYEDIAADLITSAGVDTDVMAEYDTKFANLLPGGSKDKKGSEVFEYVASGPVPAISTVTWKWDKAKKLIEGPTWKSQQPEWNMNHQLSYDIGSIEIGQKWSMKYRMQAKQAGTYDVFGSGSLLQWTDWDGVAQSLGFPETPVTVLEPGTLPIDVRLLLSNLHTVNSAGEVTDLIKENEPFTFVWSLYFTNTDPNGKANLKIQVTKDDNGYDVSENLADARQPKNEWQEISKPWDGLPIGTYTVTVYAQGDGNNAEPLPFTFHVVADPKGPKIILR